MKKFFLSIFTFLFFLCILSSSSVNAFTPLDKILSYEITIDAKDDATLDMEYDINWKVLNDNIEGPLTWVKIGVPNRFVYDIKPLSSAIKDLEYYNDDGAFIRCDLDREYKANEIVNIHFKFNQKRIFTKTNNEDTIEYAFKPGWFSEIQVEKLIVKWSKGIKPLFTNCDRTTDSYYIWEKSLDYNETIECQMKYSMNLFPNINLKMDYSDQTFNPITVIVIILVCLVVFAIIVIACVASYRATNDGYYSYRGFTGESYFHHFWFHSIYYHSPGYSRKGKPLVNPTVVNSSKGGHSSSGSHCACACACACAGGGRAGCSRKDFYNPNGNLEKLEKSLNNN